MAKHKEIKMWAAEVHESWVHHDKEIKTYCGRVVETPKQYKIVNDHHDEKQQKLIRCCGYKSNISKEGNIWLHPTELCALKALDASLIKHEQNASARASVAQENLFLITEALEDYNG